MRFFVRKRKQTPTVIIVALIDILIVLLIFLMVTTTFKQQPALRLALPESTQSQKSAPTRTHRSSSAWTRKATCGSARRRCQ